MTRWLFFYLVLLFLPSARSQQLLSYSEGRLLYFLDSESAIVQTDSHLWDVGEIVAVESQTPGVGVIGFLQITRLEKSLGNSYELKAKLVRHSRYHFIQNGDRVLKLDLSGDNPSYLGTTELIIEKSDRNISSRYRPLVFQGLLIGETAQTLWSDEFLVTYYGDLIYGLNDRLSLRSLIPGNFVGAYNLKAKYKAVDTVANTLSVGLSMNKIPNETASVLNLDIFWDSISSETTISHTFISLALFSFDRADKTTAIKSLGTSSIQSGYELIMDDWARVLFGPVYNFEKKALGGYLSYMKIWDRFHFSATLSSTNVSSLKFAPEDGYYALIDGFWRF